MQIWFVSKVWFLNYNLFFWKKTCFNYFCKIFFFLMNMFFFQFYFSSTSSISQISRWFLCICQFSNFEHLSSKFSKKCAARLCFFLARVTHAYTRIVASVHSVVRSTRRIHWISHQIVGRSHTTIGRGGQTTCASVVSCRRSIRSIQIRSSSLCLCCMI